MSDSNLLSQTQYDQKVLEYGQKLYLQIWTHMSVEHEDKNPPEKNYQFFRDSFPIFEQAAQKFYSPNDLDMKLLHLFFQSVSVSEDLKVNGGNTLGGYYYEDEISKKFEKIVKHCFRQVMAYTQTPLYEKIMLAKELPPNDMLQEEIKTKNKI